MGHFIFVIGHFGHFVGYFVFMVLTSDSFRGGSFVLDSLLTFLMLLVSLVSDAFADREGSIHPSIRRIFTSPVFQQYILFFSVCLDCSVISFVKLPLNWLADLLERANSWVFLQCI